AEMAFAGHCGINVDISSFDEDTLAALFNEELGAVIQINGADKSYVEECFAQAGLASCVHYLGTATQDDAVIINSRDTVVYHGSRSQLRQWWAETTWQMQRLRDNEVCADEEHAMKQDDQDPGLHAHLTFDIEDDVAAPYILSGVRPKVAVLREQGVNSHVEMAAAFDRAG
ncbi:phosphoribosylformylglycinamidine synthase subunit PurQ, partial [Providencia huaxiensis]